MLNQKQKQIVAGSFILLSVSVLTLASMVDVRNKKISSLENRLKEKGNLILEYESSRDLSILSTKQELFDKMLASQKEVDRKEQVILNLEKDLKTCESKTEEIKVVEKDVEVLKTEIIIDATGTQTCLQEKNKIEVEKNSLQTQLENANKTIQEFNLCIDSNGVWYTFSNTCRHELNNN